jgi:hypothetical protein
MTSQVARFRSDSLAILQKELGADGFQIASKRSSEILDEFMGIANHPFYGFDRPLTSEEYASVMTEIRNKLREIPPIALPPGEKKENEELDTLFGTPEKETAETGTAAITDRGRAERVISKALDSLYIYSRAAGPQSFKKTDQLHDLEARARGWLADAKQRHGQIITEWMLKNRATEHRPKPSSPSPAETPKIQPTSPPTNAQEQPLKVAAVPPAPTVNHLPWAILVMTVVLAIAAIAALKIYKAKHVGTK